MSLRCWANVVLLLAVATGRTTSAQDSGRKVDFAQPAARGQEQTAEQPLVKQPLGESNAAERGRVVARNPRVLFITSRGCERCTRELENLRRPGGDFDAMKSRGWKIGESADSHLQIVDREAVADLVRQLGVREFPTVACVDNGEIVRSFKDGCTTPLDAWTFGWLLKGQNERPTAPIPEPIRVASTGSYPLRGNHWTVDGDWNPTQATLISHLRGPNHGQQLETNWKIEDWSYEELRSLHDDLHEREIANGGGVYYGSQPAVQSSNQFSASRKVLGR